MKISKLLKKIYADTDIKILVNKDVIYYGKHKNLKQNV